jgi:hypothetical protein
MGSPLRERVAALLAEVTTGIALDDLAWRVGYRPARRGRLAVLSALRSLEREGLAGYFRSAPDRWGVMLWCPMRKFEGRRRAG